MVNGGYKECRRDWNMTEMSEGNLGIISKYSKRNSYKAAEIDNIEGTEKDKKWKNGKVLGK